MKSPRVLVVEDDLEIRESLMDVLEDAGFEAVGAGNGLEALDQLRGPGPQPCLIFLDLMMPRMDGRAFRQEQLAPPRAGLHPRGGHLRVPGRDAPCAGAEARGPAQEALPAPRGSSASPGSTACRPPSPTERYGRAAKEVAAAARQRPRRRRCPACRPCSPCPSGLDHPPPPSSRACPSPAPP